MNLNMTLISYTCHSLQHGALRRQSPRTSPRHQACPVPPLSSGHATLFLYLAHLSITCLFFVVVPATTAILAMRLGAALGCLPLLPPLKLKVVICACQPLELCHWPQSANCRPLHLFPFNFIWMESGPKAFRCVGTYVLSSFMSDIICNFHYGSDKYSPKSYCQRLFSVLSGIYYPVCFVSFILKTKRSSNVLTIQSCPSCPKSYKER